MDYNYKILLCDAILVIIYILNIKKKTIVYPRANGIFLFSILF